jgi:hypothetical protein
MSYQWVSVNCKLSVPGDMPTYQRKLREPPDPSSVANGKD